MLNLLLISSLSFLICFISIPVVLKVCKAKKLYDIPDERKLHTHLTPSLGGVAIFIAFLITSLLFIRIDLYNFQYYYAALVIMFFVGLTDDLMNLRAITKLIAQIAVAAILIHLAGLQIRSMYGLFGINELPEAFSIALSYLTIIFIINSFNLIDGVDGLAGSLGVISSLTFGILFFFADINNFALAAFAIAGALLAFLIFNYHPAKIFMGDTGALVIGLISTILVLNLIKEFNSYLVFKTLPSAVVVGIAILIVPLFDTLRVFTIRILGGRSPFSPDRNHIHHLLLDNGFNARQVTFICMSINLVFIITALLLKSLSPTALFFIISGMAVVVFGGMYVYYRYKSILNSRQNTIEQFEQETKIVAFNQVEVIAN